MQGGAGLDQNLNGGGGGYTGGRGGAVNGRATGGEGFVSSITLDSSPYTIASADLEEVYPPRNGDLDWDGVAGTTESRGLVVIHFVCDRPPPL